MPYSMQQTKQNPNDPPRMGAKSSTILAIIPVPQQEVVYQFYDGTFSSIMEQEVV